MRKSSSSDKRRDSLQSRKTLEYIRSGDEIINPYKKTINNDHYSSIGGEEEGIDFDEIADDVINNDEIFENVINNDEIFENVINNDVNSDDGLENWYYNQEDLIYK